MKVLTGYWLKFPAAGKGLFFENDANDSESVSTSYNTGVEDPQTVISHLNSTLGLFFEAAERQRKYLFLVRREKQKKRKGTSDNKVGKAKHKIVMLGRPPGDSIRATVDAHGTPLKFGFVRRQHRRTLTDERYRNHPKYEIHKGVLVRQAWCGPEEYRHNKRIYKLWTPPEYD